MIGLLLALQLAVPISSEWAEGPCITATGEFVPWEFVEGMAINWWRIDREQQLTQVDGTVREWTLTGYTVRITGPAGVQEIPIDSYQVSRWQPADVPGEWCAAVRAEGLVDGEVGGLLAPASIRVKDERMSQ
jgi:hypothetical protein